MHCDMFLVGFVGFVYYVISMIVGIIIMEDNISTSRLWKNSSPIYKVWNWILIVFLWVPVIYTPARIIMFVFSRKIQKHFFTILMSTFKKESYQ